MFGRRQSPSLNHNGRPGAPAPVAQDVPAATEMLTESGADPTAVSKNLPRRPGADASRDETE